MSIETAFPSASGLAQIVVQAYKLPQLSGGNLTIKVALEWQNVLEDYFLVKETPDKKKVASAIMTFRDVLMRDWIRTYSVRLRALDYDNFVKEFKQQRLP